MSLDACPEIQIENACPDMIQAVPTYVEICKPWTRMAHIPGGDFKTSTGYNHRYIHPISDRHQVLQFKVPGELREQSVHIKESAFETTYGTSSEWKYNESDPVDRANKVSQKSIHYISPIGEKMRSKPPNPPPEALSEYNRKYKLCINLPQPQNVDFKREVFCKIQSTGKDEQPSLQTSSTGYMKHLDPYVTTSHFVHHVIPMNEAAKYKHKKLDYVPSISPQVIPVYDFAVFGVKKYIERKLPKRVNPVPHTGMETEMKNSYRIPFNELISSPISKTPVFLRGLADASKGDILATPAMYMTEYNHIGKNWPIKAVVN